MLEDHRLPLVSLGLSFRRGEAMLAPEDAGLASFTAELLERGAGGRDANEFAEYVDEIGASFGGAAGWDSLSVGVSGLSRDLDRLFEVLADGTLRPHFEAEEAERAPARAPRNAESAVVRGDLARNVSTDASRDDRGVRLRNRSTLPERADDARVARPEDAAR